MPKQVEYWDSQAAAAADLKIDIYEIREAKRAGCRAFRSGRVYKQELRAWIAAKPAPKESIDLNSDEISAAPDWNDRQMALFRVLWCPYDAYFDDRIDLKSFLKIGQKTLEYVLRLARAWQVDVESIRESWQNALNDVLRASGIKLARLKKTKAPSWEGIPETKCAKSVCEIFLALRARKRCESKRPRPRDPEVKVIYVGGGRLRYPPGI